MRHGAETLSLPLETRFVDSLYHRWESQFAEAVEMPAAEVVETLSVEVVETLSVEAVETLSVEAVETLLVVEILSAEAETRLAFVERTRLAAVEDHLRSPVVAGNWKARLFEQGIAVENQVVLAAIVEPW